MTRVEKILNRHYRDMLDLNQKFIGAMSRPQPVVSRSFETGSNLRKKPTKKQLKALAEGRKILASKRLQIAK